MRLGCAEHPGRRLLLHLRVQPPRLLRDDTLVCKANWHALRRLSSERVHVHCAEACLLIRPGVVVLPLRHVPLLAEARVRDRLAVEPDWEAVPLRERVVRHKRLLCLRLRPPVGVLVLPARASGMGRGGASG